MPTKINHSWNKINKYVSIKLAKDKAYSEDLCFIQTLRVFLYSVYLGGENEFGLKSEESERKVLIASE